MIEGNKTDRQAIYSILQQIQITKFTPKDQAGLMQALGFEVDVPFAKSLFSDTLSQKYQQCKGQFQQFVAKDCVADLPVKIRQRFMQIVRMYHQGKVGQEKVNPVGHLSLPEANNIKQIIQFQKNMYQMVKHLIPSKTNKPPSPSKAEPNHYSYPFQSDRSLKQFDSDLFPPNPSPFVPSIANPSFGSHSHSFSRHDSKGNPKDPFYDNSLFLKPRQSSDIDPFKSPIDPGFKFQSIKEQTRSPKGFTAFMEGQNEEGINPSKKVKEDCFTPRFAQLQKMKKEIAQLSQPQAASEEEKERTKRMFPQKDGEVLIKQSVSEYISEQMPQLKKEK